MKHSTKASLQPGYEYAGYKAVFYHPGFEHANGIKQLSTCIGGIGENVTTSLWFRYRRTVPYDKAFGKNDSLIVCAGTYVFVVDHYNGSSGIKVAYPGGCIKDLETVLDFQYHHLVIVETRNGTKYYMDNALAYETGATLRCMFGGEYGFSFGAAYPLYSANVTLDFQDIAILPIAATAQDVNTLYLAH